MHKKLRAGGIIKLAIFSVIARIGLLGGANQNVSAVGCPEVEIIFVRGSGGTRWVDDNYNAFKNALEPKLKLTNISYEFLDLDYIAIGVGLTNMTDIKTTLGAMAGSGDAYAFGESVDDGVAELARVVNETCPETKFVAGGYSQGAMVVSKALRELNPEKVIYMATFGDPKIYLPEGKGLYPDACKGRNLSEYRVYVPDCRAYEGKLGSYQPYAPEGFSGKVGTWCNKHDIFCTPFLDLVSHVSYIKDDLYEEASKTIFDKIVTAFGVENPYTAAHDTAILFDESYTRANMIGHYIDEARKLAKETLAKGGRVAFYMYNNDYWTAPVREVCGFQDCDMAKIEQALAGILSYLYQDRQNTNSLMPFMREVMNRANWKDKVVKSLAVFSDAAEPGRDVAELAATVKLSKSIDPVNIYVMTAADTAAGYAELAAETGGKVMIYGQGDLKNEIMARYDSLPRVEEMDFDELESQPEITEFSYKLVSADAAEISWRTDGVMTMAFLNDGLIGVTDLRTLTLTGLDAARENIVTLVPLSETISGERVELRIELGKPDNEKSRDDSDDENINSVIIPKAPNTGKAVK